jgi:hypothetical protein
MYILCVLLESWLVYGDQNSELTAFNPGVNESDNGIINIAVILPFNNSYLWSLPKVRPAIDYAVQTIARSVPALLPNKQLKVVTRDSQCSDALAPLAAMDLYWRREAHVFVGPACDYAVAPIARYTPYWNIPFITGGAMVRDFRNKTQYFVTRISGSYDQVGRFLATIFAQFNWLVPGMIFHNYEGERRLQLGNSNCYFIMSGVREALFEPFKRAGHDKLWHSTFDEMADDVHSQYDSILKKLNVSARSMSFLSLYLSPVTILITIPVTCHHSYLYTCHTCHVRYNNYFNPQIIEHIALYV